MHVNTSAHKTEHAAAKPAQAAASKAPPGKFGELLKNAKAAAEPAAPSAVAGAAAEPQGLPAALPAAAL